MYNYNNYHALIAKISRLAPDCTNVDCLLNFPTFCDVKRADPYVEPTAQNNVEMKF